MTVEKIEQSHRRVILIMGMHRSGTSAVTRVVNLLGADLGGELISPGFDNPKGFWELAAAVKINDDLLRGLGRTWYDMREMPRDWLVSHAAKEALARITRVIRKDFSGKSLCVLKDPRLCLVSPLWIKAFEACGFDVSCLFVIRDPNAVIDSLHIRNNWPRAPLFLMWAQYLMEAEVETADSPRTMISYEQLVSDWRSTMIRVAEGLGFQWPISFAAVAGEIDDFLERDHKSLGDDVGASASGLIRVLPKFVSDLYEACLGILDRKGDWGGVSRLRKSFKSAAELYAPHVDNLLNERWAAEAEAQAAKTTLAEVESASIAEWSDRLNSINSEVANLSSRMDQFLARIASMEKQEEQAMADSTRVQTLEQAFEELAGKVAETDAMLIERIADTRSQQERSQEEVRERLGQLEQRFSEQVSTLSALELRWQRRVDRQERLLQTLHRRIEQLEPSLTGKLDAIERTQQDLQQAMSADIMKAPAMVRELTERINALTSSTSWKVTAPLRWLKMLLRPRARVLK